MSEIQDAAQIIKVSFEGAEIILKMGNTGWQFVKIFVRYLKFWIRKLSGKLLYKAPEMGGDLQVFRLNKDLERVKPWQISMGFYIPFCRI